MSSVELSIEDDDPWAISQDIFNILCDFTQSSTPPSVAAAARSLNALYPDNRPQQGTTKEGAESFLLEMWDVVLKVAIQLPSGSVEQEKLATLLKTMRGLEPAHTLHIWGRPITLWNDLPLLGPAMTEKVNGKKI